MASRYSDLKSTFLILVPMDGFAALTVEVWKNGY